MAYFPINREKNVTKINLCAEGPSVFSLKLFALFVVPVVRKLLLLGDRSLYSLNSACYNKKQRVFD